MRVLLIGNGGREHALAYKLAASPLLTQLFIVPGNPGTAQHGENVVLNVKDHAAIIAFCHIQAIDLVIVGPEAPLVAGLADDLMAAGIRVFGPSKAAAQLEGSKDFTKKICDEASIPTARYATFADEAAAIAYIKAQGVPIVTKYDGLMAGKGVTVALREQEAIFAISTLYAGEVAAKVVIEERLEGEEVSFFCLIDGETVLPLGSAQDHKRAFDGDEGPNTGGMGAYSPAPMMDDAMENRVLEEIIRPTAQAMVKRGTPYRGVLFAGLMITAEGPKLIEYNCRFGDPECQVLMLRLKDDLLTLLDSVARGELKHLSVRLHSHAALGIVMATQGYPGDYTNGSAISGLESLNAREGVTLFHAGTKLENGQLVAHGGRVLALCATGADLREARERAYLAIKHIHWPEGFYRSDIGARGMAFLTHKDG